MRRVPSLPSVRPVLSSSAPATSFPSHHSHTVHSSTLPPTVPTTTGQSKPNGNDHHLPQHHSGASVTMPPSCMLPSNTPFLALSTHI
jgi:hypothetical protein